VRRSTGSACPPNQIGIGRCTGMGRMPASGMVCHLPLEVHQRLGPTGAQQHYLFPPSERPRLWKFSFRARYFDLGSKPTHAPGASRPAAEQVQRGVPVFGHQGRLPLAAGSGNAGDKLEPLGETGQVGEQHKYLVKRGLESIRPAPTARAVRVGAQHVS